MYKVHFKYSDETYIIQKLINSVNALCTDKSKSCTCTSGYRSLEKQKIINAQKLTESKTNYQVASGAVYNAKGQCVAAAYGKSNHCYCIAMDIPNKWFKVLTNSELKKYGLIKPMSYEPWHVQLLEHNGITQAEKEAIRDSVLKGVDEDMDIKEFQTITGLTADGIAGLKTKAKAKEVLQCCQEILGLNYQTAEELIKSTQSSPDIWLTLLKVVKYFDLFLMNIYKKMRGE